MGPRGVALASTVVPINALLNYLCSVGPEHSKLACSAESSVMVVGGAMVMGG